LKIIVPGGENAKLGQTIGIIGEKGEDFSALLNGDGATSNGSKPTETGEQQKTDSPTADEKSTGQSQDQKPKTEDQAQNVSETEGRSYDYDRPDAVEDAKSETVQAANTASSSGNGRLIVSPIAARMAAENGIDLKSIKGSGPSGRVIKRDIESALAAGSQTQQPQQAQNQEVAPATSKTPEIQGASGFREENTSQMRRTIANRLATSIGPVPTFYLTIEIEMDEALAFRKQINSSIKEDEKVSVNDIIVKVAAMASLKHPFVNSSYQDKTIRFYEDADVGVAVAIEDGLITPIVRGANRKGITEISREIKEMAGRARERKLQPEEYTGATFSISNLGMFGIEQFTAIINPPEAAIFAIGSAAPKAVVRNGEIVIKNIMNVTMSCDHRVIDGATGAKFLQTFKQMLENPILMLM
jgi:pyruvate dehydrogenase E2 component (dihydrolipoamide acetyltransferase)